MNDRARALVPTQHPDNAPLAEPRSRRISRLSDELRERTLHRLQTANTADNLAKSVNEILREGDNKTRVLLLVELLRLLLPQPKTALEQPTVAIQINAGLRRGTKEFA